MVTHGYVNIRSILFNPCRQVLCHTRVGFKCDPAHDPVLSCCFSVAAGGGMRSSKPLLQGVIVVEEGKEVSTSRSSAGDIHRHDEASSASAGHDAASSASAGHDVGGGVGLGEALHECVDGGVDECVEGVSTSTSFNEKSKNKRTQPWLFLGENVRVCA